MSRQTACSWLDSYIVILANIPKSFSFRAVLSYSMCRLGKSFSRRPNFNSSDVSIESFIPRDELISFSNA